jgi:hypothetical protein
VSDLLVLALVLLLVASGYAAGRVHGQVGYREGYRSGYRQGHADGARSVVYREPSRPVLTEPAGAAPQSRVTGADDHGPSESRQYRPVPSPALSIERRAGSVSHKVRHTKG